MTGNPVLIFAAGQRCGSTLVQRLLSSHPDVLIWGEHAGQLRPIIAAVSRMKVWSAEDGMDARADFEGGGYQSFMANLTPEGTWIDEAMRQLKEHPRLGGEILATLSNGERVQKAIESHHECFDGSGYPAGLRGEDIVLQIDGVPIQSPGDLQKLMIGDAIGKRIEISVYRNDSLLRLSATPTELVV